MKKITVALLLTALSISVLGCNAGTPQKNTETTSSEKESVEDSVIEDDGLTEVVFANRIHDTFMEESRLTRNRIQLSHYEQMDADTLYAFYVINSLGWVDDGGPMYDDVIEYDDGRVLDDYMKLVHRFNANDIAEKMRELGLTVLENYSYCCFTSDYLKVRDMDNKLVLGFCTVLGTLEELEALFDNEKPLDKHYFELRPAPRPDILDYIEESGWSEETGIEPLDWYNQNADAINQMLGEEEQIVVRMDLSKEKNPDTMAPTDIEYAVEMHDVIFANQIPEKWEETLPEVAVKNKEWTTNLMEDYYTVVDDPDALYAFCISETKGLGNPVLARAKSLVWRMRELGLMVIEDYPYCYATNEQLVDADSGEGLACGYCTVVGTMEELQALFDGTDNTRGWHGILYDLRPAPRPDILDYMQNEKELGEKKQIIVNVPLIMPY